MVCLEQDVLLQLGGLYLVVLKNDVFAERLHGEHFPVCLLLNEEDLTEGSFSNDGDKLEVIELDIRLIRILYKGCNRLGLLLEVELFIAGRRAFL